MSKTWKNKNILITGASGFVGSNAVHYFSKLDANITAIVSQKSPVKKRKINLDNTLQNVEIVSLNLLDGEKVEKVTKNQDIILHFAAIDGNAAFKKKYSADILSQNTR